MIKWLFLYFNAFCLFIQIYVYLWYKVSPGNFIPLLAKLISLFLVLQYMILRDDALPRLILFALAHFVVGSLLENP